MHIQVSLKVWDALYKLWQKVLLIVFKIDLIISRMGNCIFVSLIYYLCGCARNKAIKILFIKFMNWTRVTKPFPFRVDCFKWCVIPCKLIVTNYNCIVLRRHWVEWTSEMMLPFINGRRLEILQCNTACSRSSQVKGTERCEKFIASMCCRLVLITMVIVNKDVGTLE